MQDLIWMMHLGVCIASWRRHWIMMNNKGGDGFPYVLLSFYWCNIIQSLTHWTVLWLHVCAMQGAVAIFAMLTSDTRCIIEIVLWTNVLYDIMWLQYLIWISGLKREVSVRNGLLLNNRVLKSDFLFRVNGIWLLSIIFSYPDNCVGYSVLAIVKVGLLLMLWVGDIAWVGLDYQQMFVSWLPI